MWNTGVRSIVQSVINVLQDNETKSPGVLREWHDSLHMHGCLSGLP